MNAVLYIHGKGGTADESLHYQLLFSNYDVIGLDYTSYLPWEVKQEILAKVKELKSKYENIILVANSIGAYFSMNAKIDKYIQKAFFISPIVDMEKLIYDMMLWANISEKDLKDKKIIHTDFGEDLSWEYLCYVKNNPISWNVNTNILYGSNDNLTSFDKINTFAQKGNYNITIMQGGEHWFHTQVQMAFLDNWILGNK